MRAPDFTVAYRSVGNCDVDTDVYLPSSTACEVATRQRPIIINLHGGAYMLGSSSMVNNDQIIDCLERGWIVVVPNHRLCPQVDILEGPITDIRALSSWIHAGHLDEHLEKLGSSLRCDLLKVVAFGTSAGGHLSLCLGFDHPHPPAAILDFYGPTNFHMPFWKQKLPMAATLPDFERDFLNRVYNEDPVATREGVSLEGQQQPQDGPDFSQPRVAFAMAHIANGTMLDACFPSGDFKKIDPAQNIHSSFPPTCIVHGDADVMVPLELSRMLFLKLKEVGVCCELIKVPNESHTFAGKMVKGSETWGIQRRGFDWIEEQLGK